MRNILLSCALLCVMSASADDYKILSMTHPTLLIDGKQAKVGDMVSDKSVVTWSDDAQTVRLYNMKTRRQAVMTAEKKSHGGAKLRELLSANRHLSTKSITIDEKAQVVDRVKEYCQLMEDISGDVEKIDKQNDLYAICEHSNVTVYNDLSAVRSKNLGDNSMTLYQYMMMLTSKYGNNVKAHHSGYKYVRTVFQPIGLVSYALVKVDKETEAGDVKQKSHLHISVNTSTMKVSSTTTEDYEDPLGIYYDALDLYNQGDMSGALEKFEKVMNLERFPGRYRAKSMAGWIYIDRGDYHHAYDLLRESSASDPLGGVLLASRILMRDDVPFSLRNYTEGMEILRRIGETRDTDFPQMHLIAKAAIFDVVFNFKSLGQTMNLNNFNGMDGMEEAFLNDSATSPQFQCRGYVLQAISKMLEKDYEGSLKSCDTAQDMMADANLGSDDQERLSVWIFSIRSAAYQQQGNQEKLLNLIQEFMEKPYGANYLALGSLYEKTGDEQKKMSLDMFRKAAEGGDALGAYIMSLCYMPIHKPVMVYEELLVRNNLVSRDLRIWKGWSDFILYVMLDDKGGQYAKNAAEFRRWNQLAIDRGSTDAMEDRALLEVVDDGLLGLSHDCSKAIELACNAACLGIRSDNEKFLHACVYAIAKERENGKEFNETESFKTLKKLDEEGNGAASYILYCGYAAYLKDNEKAHYYLERSKDAKFSMGMSDYASELIKTDPDKAFALYEELTIYAKTDAYYQMGKIEQEHRKNYGNAMKYYKMGFNNDEDWKCCEAISDLYREGLGVDVNLEEAKDWIGIATSKRKIQVSNYLSDDHYQRLVRKEAQIDSLIALGGSAEATGSPLARLNKVLDTANSEDARIELSQQLLTELFASPQAVVKTQAANRQTIVSTETAEDFMLRLATMNGSKKISEVSSRKNADGKFTELTVRIE